MRNLKKVLVMVLALAMMLSIMVVGAGASSFTDQKDIDSKHQEAVDMAIALNIIIGYPDGSFKPNDNVSREEMAKMICILDNGGKEPQLAVGNSFTDVEADRWSNKYIEACASRGVVAGVGDNKFDPAGQVTATQAARMLLVELGFDQEIANYTGPSWATYVNVDATQRGYYTDLEDIDVTAPLTREHAAQMVWNALKASEVEYENVIKANNGVMTSTPVLKDKWITNANQNNGIPYKLSLLADKYGVIDNQSAKMVRFDYDSHKGEWNYYFGTGFKDGKGDPIVSFSSKTDFTSLYGQDVKVIYTLKSNQSDVDQVFGMYPKDGKVLFSGVVGGMNELKVAGTDSKVKFDGTEYKLEKDANSETYFVPVYAYSYDTQFGTAALYTKADIVATTNDQASKGFIADAVDNDDNGKIDFFVIHPFTVQKVDYVAAKNFTLKDQAGATTSKKFEDVVAYAGMAEKDFVLVTNGKNSPTGDYTIEKIDSSDIVAGNITATKGATPTMYEFALDGKWYEAVTDVNMSSGGTAKDVVSHNGYVFMFDASGSKTAQDYVVVMDSNLTAAYGGTAKLLFADGTKKIVNVDTIYTDNTKQYKDNSATDTTILGQLYTYETNSDGDYLLAPAAKQSAGSGFDNYNATATAITDKNGSNSSSNKVKYINNWDISDDAVVFVREGTHSFKEISGARLKSVSVNTLTNIATYADNDSSSGYGKVKLAYLNSTNSIVGADFSYGYITSAPSRVENSDKVNVYQVTFVDQNGAKKVLNTKDASLQVDVYKSASDTKMSLDTALAKGVVFKYTTNTSGDIDQIVFLGRAGSTNPTNTSYISGVDGDFVSFNDGTTRYEITKDTVVFVIDAENAAAGEGKVSKAHKNTAGNYVDNAIYEIDTGHDLALLVIDTNGDICDAE